MSKIREIVYFYFVCYCILALSVTDYLQLVLKVLFSETILILLDITLRTSLKFTDAY